jgi:hypothetical protein
VLGHFEGELYLRYVPMPRRRWWLRWLPQRRRWIVDRPFRWCGPASDPVCYEVPAGFETDFASIPFLLLLLLGPMNGWVSDYGRSALIHDLLYRTGLVSRPRADATFYTAMVSEWVLWPTRFTMWAAVRCFGWTAYQPA